MKVAIIEKPSIPQFVADWLESLYDEGGNWQSAIGIMFEYSCVHDKPVHDWFVENKDEFIIAVMYGYNIKQEPKYYARIKGWELIDDERDIMYWMIDKQDNGLFVSELPQFSFDLNSEYGYITKLTAREWNELGVGDGMNAVFITEEDMNESNL